MKYFLPYTLILSLVSLTAFAENAPERWELELQPHIKALPRAVDIYTWDLRSKMGSFAGDLVLPNDRRALEFLKREAAKFQRSSEELKYEGPNGVYFASGPFVSREWGSNQKPLFQGDREWMLIRVRLPEGTRYLDGRSTLPFGRQLLTYIASFGCRAGNMRELLNVSSRADKRECWNAYTKIVPKIKVYVMAKEFISIAPEYCPIQNTHFTDFIAVDESVMRDYAVFVSEIPSHDSGNLERFFIRDYWLLAKQTVANKCPGVMPYPVNQWWDRFKKWDTCKFFVTSPDQYEIPWNLPASPYTAQQMRFMTEKRIYGCGPKAKQDTP